tara:strand:- start:1288 stop:1584 length:297 start_codon:yes stop_codon:yes gene_type:complete
MFLIGYSEILLMDLAHLLNFLAPFHEKFSKFYSIAAYTISAVFILWIFNLIASFIYRTYLLGKAFGNFYRNYFHRFLKAIFLQVSSLVGFRKKIQGNI